MCRSLVDIGLTTISSVWNTPSTTMPKVWLPTWVTTMKPFSGSEEEPSSILSSFFRCISGNSLLRSRKTAVSLMRSMRCSELARARTSSTTDSCGIAKRSPAASTIRAETMASVSGILMVTRGALAGHRLDVDGAADLVDIGAHHVHADAAAGDRGDGGRGREARREDELVDLGFGHLLQFGLGDETVLERLGLDPLGVEPAAVVGDADDDVAALVIGGQPDGALLAPCRRPAARPASPGRDRRSCAPCASADP